MQRYIIIIFFKAICNKGINPNIPDGNLAERTTENRIEEQRLILDNNYFEWFACLRFLWVFNASNNAI